MKHWISMSGNRGYMPDHSDVHETKGGAIETLLLIHEDQTDDHRYCLYCLSCWPTDEAPETCPRDGQTLIPTWKAAEQMRLDLAEYGWFDQFPEGHGAEYAEIQECDCKEPWVHSENVDVEFMRRVDLHKALINRGLIGIQNYLDGLEWLAEEFLNG